MHEFLNFHILIDKFDKSMQIQLFEGFSFVT